MTSKYKFIFVMHGVLAVLLLLTTHAHATHRHIRMMDFDDLRVKERVGEFYNGGTGGFGSGPGPDFGVTFSPSASIINDSEMGTSGNIGFDSSDDKAIHFRFDNKMVVNVPDGFQKGLNFYYSSRTLTQLVVYSEVDATGEEIASTFLNIASFGTGEVDGFGPVYHIGLGTSDGVRAKSFAFISEEESGIVIDKLEIGKAYPEPVTGILALMGVGTLGTALRRRR